MKKKAGGGKAEEQSAKNYILEYYQAITDGSVTVGHWIREWYGQIVNGLQERRFFFNQKKANMVIRFIQTFCRHHEGPLAPGRIRLELWQKAMISVIFGIVDDDGVRVFREILIIMGRKNGKTLLSACLMAAILYLDPDYGKRVYTVATKLDQARLSYEALYQMIQKEPELAEITKKRRTDIYIAETNSSDADRVQRKEDGRPEPFRGRLRRTGSLAGRTGDAAVPGNQERPGRQETAAAGIHHDGGIRERRDLRRDGPESNGGH